MRYIDGQGEKILQKRCCIVMPAIMLNNATNPFIKDSV